jgi:hypothetical protein
LEAGSRASYAAALEQNLEIRQSAFGIRAREVANLREQLPHAGDTLANPFQGGMQNPTGSSLGALTNLGQAINWLNQNPLRPYSREHSLHVQHQLRNWLLEAGYSHNNTYDLPQGP